MMQLTRRQLAEHVAEEIRTDPENVLESWRGHPELLVHWAVELETVIVEEEPDGDDSRSEKTIDSQPPEE